MIVDDSWKLTAKEDTLRRRAWMMQAIRRFFQDQDFLEVETPLRIPAPAPESHIDAIASEEWFLQTSPELCMKRLLAAGYPRVFQICKCFRAGERGRLHLSEFTMLEWYVAGFDYRLLMKQCEEMIIAAARDLGLADRITYRAREINLACPWEAIPVEEAFKKYSPVTMTEALNRDNFDEILVEYIEPNLGINRPAFLHDYPAQMASLARLKEGNNSVAERFELYIGGVELANGFSELTDAPEQRRRFMEAQKMRAQKNYAAYPLPEKFLSALDNLPASAGIALGIDRLAMIFTNAAGIDDVVAFPPEIL